MYLFGFKNCCSCPSTYSMIVLKLLVAHTICSVWWSEKWNGNAQDCVFWMRVGKKSTDLNIAICYLWIHHRQLSSNIQCVQKIFIPKVFKARHVQETVHIASDWSIWVWLVGAYDSFKSEGFESFFLPYATICTPFVVLWLLMKLWNKPTVFVWVKITLPIFLARPFSWP